MYARSGERTLLFVMQMYRGDHWTYALQTIHVDVRGTTERMLLFEYPLVNTWTYEAAFRPLGEDHRTYTPLAKHPLLCQGSCWQPSPINTPYPSSFFTCF
jgi:hypothetical protein